MEQTKVKNYIANFKKRDKIKPDEGNSGVNLNSTFKTHLTKMYNANGTKHRKRASMPELKNLNNSNKV